MAQLAAAILHAKQQRTNVNKPLVALPRYEDAHESPSADQLERVFIFCLTWSLGGLLNESDRCATRVLSKLDRAPQPPRLAPLADEPSGRGRPTGKGIHADAYVKACIPLDNSSSL